MWKNSRLLSYDQFGSMLSNDLTFPNAPANNWYSSFSVDPANNRLNSYSNNLGQTSIGYDLAGNILSDGVKSFVYDGAGRIASLDPNTSVYRYDALGRRVKKTYTYQNQSEATISGNIISIYGPAGELLADYTTENGPSGSNNSRTDYILNESEAVGKRTVPQSGSETIEGFHRSHLNQIFDPATYSVNSGLSSMHGIPYRSGGNEQFTGHKDDPESGLHYNLARSYNPVTARWTSPDTIVGNAYDPLSLNKYGYNRNDPMNRVDPDGRTPITLEDLNLLLSYLSNGGKIQIADQIIIVSDSGYATELSNSENPPLNPMTSSPNLDTRAPDQIQEVRGGRENQGGSGLNSKTVQKEPKSPLYKRVLSWFCGSSPQQRIIRTVKFSAAKYAITGAIAGGGAAGIATFGFGGVPGAAVGAFAGGTIGAGGGIIWGSAYAGACYGAGYY